MRINPEILIPYELNPRETGYKGVKLPKMPNVILFVNYLLTVKLKDLGLKYRGFKHFPQSFPHWQCKIQGYFNTFHIVPNIFPHNFITKSI